MNLTRIEWGIGCLLVIGAVVACLVPGQDLPASFELNDKISHMVGHAALALYFAGLVPRRRWWRIFVFLLLLGSAIEVAQYYMQLGREGDPRDVIANAAGALFGLLLGRLGLARWPQLAAWIFRRIGVAQ
ncbi:MAG TPA: VanZ family protein [Steroidobacteraceae bacterium]|nr:VanZ family protein [Steroidobacteraceae bacterium]